MKEQKWGDWEGREQQRFEIRLLERDDKVKTGILLVNCVELEALRSRFGNGGPLNQWQEVHSMEVTSRTTDRPALERHPDFIVDLEMVWPFDSPFPDDFKM